MERERESPSTPFSILLFSHPHYRLAGVVGDVEKCRVDDEWRSFVRCGVAGPPSSFVVNRDEA